MTPIEADEFFAAAGDLRRPVELRRIIDVLPADSTVLYDLTFHAAFASRLFAILKREGSSIQGYERMQQSLADSVQLVRGLLEGLERDFDINLGIATSGAESAFGGLVEDLSKLKAWMLERSQNT